jgi:glycosyltransferase involved in cell wall biosynthesis
MIREEQGVAIPVVFCGYHADLQRTAWLNELKRLARRHGLGGQARFLGYVSNDEICSLYAGATALVMPTYCGPTVIPVLEAWATQCPVVTSNIPGIREQVGDAGVLVDPRSVESIATAIQQVWRSEPLRRSLAEKGQERLRKHNFESFCAGLAAVIAEAQP